MSDAFFRRSRDRDGPGTTRDDPSRPPGCIRPTRSDRPAWPRIPARPVRIGSRSGPPTAAARPVRRPVAARPDRPVRRRRGGSNQMGQGGINGIKPLSGTLKPTEVPAAHRHGSAARRRACSRRPDPVRSESIRSDPVGGRSPLLQKTRPAPVGKPRPVRHKTRALDVRRACTTRSSGLAPRTARGSRRPHRPRWARPGCRRPPLGGSRESDGAADGRRP